MKENKDSGNMETGKTDLISEEQSVQIGRNIEERPQEKQYVEIEGLTASRRAVGISEGEACSLPEGLYQELIERVRKYHPSDDLSMIEKAYYIAYKAHEGQLRKSGEPYIIHPLNVAIILADLEMDKETMAAGLLHDVVEDTVLTMEELEQQFGSDVAWLVDGVTKLKDLPLTNAFHEMHEQAMDKKYDITDEKLELQAENLRKMFLAMAKDIRVIIIKLADRLHNMRTLKFQPEHKQKRIARETLEIYCPIAERLGISRIKVELDDLSLKYLEPDFYYDIADKISSRKVDRELFIFHIVTDIKKYMQDAGIDAKVFGRAKHFFSIYKKMKNQQKTIDQIYDLFAVRIIVESVRDCYAALGIIHEMYKPVPGRFKDYIAMPKLNMYQSLHTTLIGSDGDPFEVQIRTVEMNKAAEYGVAAHWKYKEASDGKNVDNSDREEQKFVWLRQILEWQRDMSDNREFMNLLKSDLDLFADNVYCFTPGGDVKNLPAGSTPIDFAYSIHSAVGNNMIGARVNGRLVNIDYVIKNGDRIEIITSQNSKGPSQDWLSIVKSPQARSKINQWFKGQYREENIERGKEMIAAYCKTKNIDFGLISDRKYLDNVKRKFGFHDWDAVLAAVGHGALKEGQVVNRILELYSADHPEVPDDNQVIKMIAERLERTKYAAKASNNGIIVKGISDVAVRFSKCCSAVPGDEIVGFITRGRGVSVHRTDCVNVINMSAFDRERLIDVEWESSALEGAGDKFTAEIKIFARNRNGLLADIAKNVSDKDINILSLNTRVAKDGTATMDMSFQIGSRQELTAIIDRLKRIESVIDIERTSG